MAVEEAWEAIATGLLDDDLSIFPVSLVLYISWRTSSIDSRAFLVSSSTSLDWRFLVLSGGSTKCALAKLLHRQGVQTIMDINALGAPYPAGLVASKR